MTARPFKSDDTEAAVGAVLGTLSVDVCSICTWAGLLKGEIARFLVAHLAHGTQSEASSCEGPDPSPCRHATEVRSHQHMLSTALQLG